MKWKKLAVLGAAVCATGGAVAAPVPLDSWLTPQSAVANVSNPMVTNTLPATVVGVASFLGDRTLSATLNSATGSIEAVIGGGFFDCNRSITGSGFCDLSYAFSSAVTLSEIIYSGFHDGAMGGVGELLFLRNNTLVASQLLTTSLQNYTTWLGTTFGVGDILTIRANAGTALDQSATQMQVTLVPEPGSIALVGLALMTAGVITRRKT